MMSFGFLLGLVFFSEHDVTFASTTHYVDAKGDIKLRDAPKSNAKVIIWIRNGSEIKVLSSANGWSYVDMLGQKGYVYTSSLKKQLKPAKATHYVKAKGDIKFRSAPNSKAKVIWTIKNGAKLTVISSSKGWSYVQYTYRKGYVYTSSLKKITAPKKTAPTVTGGLRPKPGLKLTYTDDFISAPGNTTFQMKKVGTDGVFFYNTKRKSNWMYIVEDKAGIAAGFTEGHFDFFNIAYPLKQGATVKNYARSNYGADGTRILIESTSKTIKVKAGTFKNVVILKFPNGIRYYLAKGVGIIKVRYADGSATELVSIK